MNHFALCGIVLFIIIAIGAFILVGLAALINYAFGIPLGIANFIALIVLLIIGWLADFIIQITYIKEDSHD